MDWLLVGKALCLVLVIEGLVYALVPASMREAAVLLASTDNRTLRRGGLLAMAIGAACLFFISH